MGAKLTGQVWSLELKNREQKVLLAMADHANDDGTNCYPSVGYIAWKTGYDYRSVQRGLAELRKTRLIIPVGSHPGPSHTQHYRVVLANGILKSPFQRPDGRTRNPAESSQATDDTQGHELTTPGTLTDDTQGHELTTPGTPTDDTAVSPQPSVTIIEPSGEASDEPPLLPGAIPRKARNSTSEQDPGRCGSNFNFPVLSSKELATGEPRETGPPEQDPLRAYAENIGPLTPLLTETIEHAVKRYCDAWIVKAIGIAVTQNKLTWAYIDGILHNWAKDVQDSPVGIESQRAPGGDYSADYQSDQDRREFVPPAEIDPKATDTWTLVLEDLKQVVDKPIFETWLEQTRGASLDSQRFVVEVPTPFAIGYLERKLYQDIQKTLERLTGETVDIQFQCSS